MGITNYFFDGGNITTAMVMQGDEVATNNKRKITGAVVCNDGGTPKALTVQVVGSGTATPVTVISGLIIGGGESYMCPELVGRGMSAGGYIQAMADLTGLDFKFEAITFTEK